MPFAPVYAVVYGTNAQPDEFPWVTKITRDSQLTEQLQIENSCTGALISKDTILTAAHCLDEKKGSLESLNISFPNDSGNSELYKAESIHIHPSFNSIYTKIFETIDEDESQSFDIQHYITHDIGIIKLRREVNDIEPVEIGTINRDNPTLYGVGYGSRGRVTTKEQANTLAIIDMSVMDVETCKQHASAANATNTSENKKSIGVSPLASSANSYCTIGNEPFSSMCHGDSGSPLIQINDGKPSVLGVLTSGASVVCAHETSYQHAPNLYTSTESHNYFVNSVVAGDTNLDKHKNLVNNPNNDKAKGEGWAFNDEDNFYLSDQEYGIWSFLHKYLGTLAMQHFLPGEPLAETASPEIKQLLDKYPGGNLIQADIKDIPKFANFFATSYLPAERHQTVDLVASTGLSAPELAQVKPSLIVSEIFTRTYCGGDRYFMKATILDEQKQSLETYSTGDRYLEGECNWDTDWYEARLDIPYVEGARYIRFEDGGQDSENWEGFYGPRMTAASVRLNTPFIVK